MTMLADISGLIGLIIFVVIAIVSALLKRKEEEPFEIPPELKPRRDQPPPQPPPGARTWEQELRELLEQRPAPPPIVREVQPTAPPPIPRVIRPYEPVEEVSHEAHDVGAHPMASFKVSESRYAEAASLQARVAQHLAEVTRHRVGTTAVQRREVSADARELIAMLHHPQTVRRAVLASIVLGPPRAFET